MTSEGPADHGARMLSWHDQLHTQDKTGGPPQSYRIHAHKTSATAGHLSWAAGRLTLPGKHAQNALPYTQ